MATSETQICNMALGAIGTRSTITSMDEASAEARNCKLYFTQTRDEVLSMAHWNFARKTATLALIKSAPGTPSNPNGAQQWSSAYPAPPWQYEYAYPSDCLQARYIVPQIDTGVIGVPLMSNVTGYYPYVIAPWAAVRFEVATDTDSQGNEINCILTNQYQAIGVYTRRVTNPNLFSSSFVTALSMALAGKMAQSLTGDRALRIEMFQRANDSITQARASDGNEGFEVNDVPADWIAARDSINPWSGGGYFVSPFAPLYPVGM